MKSELAEAIIEMWNLSQKPEYRGFRCASCQQYNNEAYCHWLDSARYRVPLHLCGNCERLLQSNKLKVDENKRHAAAPPKFEGIYPAAVEARFGQLTDGWSMEDSRQPTAFYCDACNEDLFIDKADGRRKGYHVWWGQNGCLYELHFHKSCGDQILRA